LKFVSIFNNCKNFENKIRKFAITRIFKQQTVALNGIKHTVADDKANNLRKKVSRDKGKQSLQLTKKRWHKWHAV